MGPPLLAAATLLVPALGAAQEPLGNPSEEREARVERQDRERCICFDETPVTPAVSPFGVRGANRGRIGVLLGDPAVVAGQTGIRLRDVVDGGPADRAGLEPGDVLLALDGEALGEEPTRRLLELMRGVEPGDTVALRFARDGAERTARAVVDENDGFAFSFADGDTHVFAMPGTGVARLGRGTAIPSMPGGPDMVGGPHVVSIDMFGYGGLELTEVNADLGRYFDTDHGVLVTDVAEESRLGLQPGDVILAIGDRDVTTPRHARGIIGSYLPDEEIPFRIMRDGRETTVRGVRGR